MYSEPPKLGGQGGKAVFAVFLPAKENRARSQNANSMKTRNFSDTTTSEVGLGCWQLGGGDWGVVDDSEALRILHAAREAGVTFFDTAYVYGGGRSETLVGRFLKDIAGDKAKILVATKLGRNSPPGGAENLTLDTMRQHTEESLRRLDVPCLDLTQLHCVPTDALRDGSVFEHLRVLQNEGKIARWGASVESMEEAHLCLAQPGLASLQIIFNIFRQKPINDLFEAAQEKNVALIVRLPLASGLLTGKYDAHTTFAASDHRTYNRDGAAFNVGETFAGLPFELGVVLADELKPYVPPGLRLSDMALRWCLDFPAVSVIIPGAKNEEQARANASVSDRPALPADLHQILRDWYENKVKEHIRGPY